MADKKILIEFDNAKTKYGAKGLTEAFNLFKEAGLAPTDVQIEDKIKRSNVAGRSYKRVFFYFESGQMVEMHVTYNKADPTQGGAIFKVLLGGAGVAASLRATELPIKNQDDHKEAIKEIVKALKDNLVSFQQRLEKLVVKVTLPKIDKETTPRPKQVEILKQSLAEYDTEIQKADSRIVELEALKLGKAA